MAATHHCRVGLHGRNHPQYHDADFRALREAKIETLKTMAYNERSLYERIRRDLPDIEFIVRLGFDDEFGVRRHPSPTNFVNRNLPVVNSLRGLVEKFEIHNEPNHQAEYEGWGPSLEDARAFHDWYDQVLTMLRQQAPWAKFGFPGLALHPRGKIRGDIEWAQVCRAQIEKSDWLGVHCYWQYDNMRHPEWGLYFQLYHQAFPNMPLEVTEFGDSTPNLRDEDMAQRYAEYYREVSRYPYVRSAICFMLSSPYHEWRPFVWRREDGSMRPAVQAVGALSREPVPIATPTPPAPTPPGKLPPLKLPGGPVPAPEGFDLVDRLLKHPTDAYPTRDRSAIRRIVIHHTATNASPEAIARYQVNTNDWPGIGYHFMVMEDGTVYQTQRLETVSRHTTSHNEDTVGIAFSGTYTNQVPDEKQMNPAAHLAAYLMGLLGLDSSAIVGRRELEDVISPGLEWNAGARLSGDEAGWKSTFVRKAQAYLPTNLPDLPDGEAGGEVGELKGRLSSAEETLQQLETGYRSLQEEPDGVVPALRTQLAALEAAIARLGTRQPGDGDGPVWEEPEIQDISAELKQHPAEKYPARELERINRIVIHHTATMAAPQAIAEYQVETNGWPGIGYHYMVMQDGSIYQTQPLHVTSRHTFNFNADSIGVALQGNFTNTVPEEPQLAALSQLVAYLILYMGIDMGRVFGRSELERVGSPGSQWNAGARWKDTLLDRVQEFLDQTGRGGAEELRRLRTRIYQLEQELAAAQDLARRQAEDLEARQRRIGELEGTVEEQKKRIASLQAQIQEQEKELQRLQEEIKELQRKLREGGVARPPVIDKVGKLPEHPEKRYVERSSKIRGIVVHHTGGRADASPEDIAHWIIQPEPKGRDWPGFPYHYYILPDGTVYYCQDISMRIWHAGAANDYTVGVAMGGNFLGQTRPPQVQLECCARLVAWLMTDLGVKIEDVVGHKEVPMAETRCPGDAWLEGLTYKYDFLAALRAALAGHPAPSAKPVGNYLLFGDETRTWAEGVWQGAQEFIKTVRPTAGFSLEDALAARRVIIVGGAFGVSDEDEQHLRSSGAEVIRLAGRNEEETRRLLMELVEQLRLSAEGEPVHAADLSAGERDADVMPGVRGMARERERPDFQRDPWALPEDL